MRRHLESISLVGTALLLAACTTWVDVKPYTGKEEGYRYSLPAPFLLVQPQPDGTATYTWIYLPDKSKTFAIEQHSFISKFTLDVTLQNGLLTSVKSKIDETGVAAKVADVGQSVYAAKQTALENKNKASATALAAAKTAVANAKLTDDQAKAEEAEIDKSPGVTPAQMLAARLKVVDADLALKQAQGELAKLQPGVGGGGAGDVPGATAAGQQQWGPMLFRVVQTGNTVRLEAVKPQAQFQTITVGGGGGGAAARGPAYKLTLDNKSPYPAAPAALSLTMSVEPAVASYGDDKSLTLVDSKNMPIMNANGTGALAGDGKTLTVTFKNGLPKGSYSLTPSLVPVGADKPVAADGVTFTVGK